MIRGLAEAAVFTGLAVALHLGGLALTGFGQGGPQAGGVGGQSVVSLQGGTPATEALLARWTDPPEVGGAVGGTAAPPAPEALRPNATDPADTPVPHSVPRDSAPPDPVAPAVLPAPVRAGSLPATRANPAPEAPRVALRTGALDAPTQPPVTVPRPDTAGAPPANRTPRAAVALDPPTDRPGNLPRVAPPPDPPAPVRPASVPTKARPEPDRNQTAAERPAPPALRAAGTGGGPAAGLSGASQQAAAEAGRDRLMALWGGRIRADVERRKHYPRAAAGAGGTAVLRIAVQGDGRLQAASLAASAGHPALDRAALDAVRGARFPPAPEGLGPGPHAFTFQMVFAP